MQPDCGSQVLALQAAFSMSQSTATMVQTAGGVLDGGRPHCNVSLWNASIEECNSGTYQSDARAYGFHHGCFV